MISSSIIVTSPIKLLNNLPVLDLYSNRNYYHRSMNHLAKFSGFDKEILIKVLKLLGKSITNFVFDRKDKYIVFYHFLFD